MMITDLPILADVSDDAVLEHDFKFFEAVKRYQLTSINHQVVAKEIANQFSINSYLEFFLDFNPSWNAPYHNRYHSLCMLCNVLEGAFHEHRYSIRGLLVGALFHDYDHTAGEQDDEVNIERALKGLEVAHFYATAMHLPLTREELDMARDAIKITKYPYEHDPITNEEMIMRDADLMQLYEHDDTVLYWQFKGLMKEINVQKNPKLTVLEFADGNLAFQDKTIWHTDWARKKAKALNFEGKKTHLRDLLISHVYGGY